MSNYDDYWRQDLERLWASQRQAEQQRLAQEAAARAQEAAARHALEAQRQETERFAAEDQHQDVPRRPELEAQRGEDALRQQPADELRARGVEVTSYATPEAAYITAVPAGADGGDKSRNDAAQSAERQRLVDENERRAEIERLERRRETDRADALRREHDRTPQHASQAASEADIRNELRAKGIEVISYATPEAAWFTAVENKNLQAEENRLDLEAWR